MCSLKRDFFGLLRVFTAVWAFSGCSERGYSLAVVRRLLTVVPSLVTDTDSRAWLSGGGAWAWLPHGMCDLSRPGIEPTSPALSGRFLTTGPPRKFLKGNSWSENSLHIPKDSRPLQEILADKTVLTPLSQSLFVTLALFHKSRDGFDSQGQGCYKQA